MSRMKKKKPSEWIVEATKDSVNRKLHKLTALQLTLWLAPLINEIAEGQELRIRKLAAAAQAIDPQWREIFGAVSPTSSTKITNDDWRLSSFYIEHKPTYGRHPYEGMCFLKGGVVFDPKLVNAPIVPEEVSLAYSTQAVAARQLPEWTKQFGDGETWDDAKLGRMCAFSPLYRTCLRIPGEIRKKGYQLPAYKYGPRGVDEVRHMSPELVHALQIASNMEDDEEEVTF